MAKVKYREVQKNGETYIEEIHKIVVHRFKMSDVEDPDLYAAEPLYQWQQSEQGKFIMANAIETPIWQRQQDFALYGYEYIIVAEIESKKLSEYYLRWGKHGND